MPSLPPHPPRVTAKRKDRSTQAPRRCLRCDKTFDSAGPHNRLCQSCRLFIEQSTSEVQPYPVPFVFHR